MRACVRVCVCLFCLFVFEEAGITDDLTIS